MLPIVIDDRPLLTILFVNFFMFYTLDKQKDHYSQDMTSKENGLVWGDRTKAADRY